MLIELKYYKITQINLHIIIIIIPYKSFDCIIFSDLSDTWSYIPEGYMFQNNSLSNIQTVKIATKAIHHLLLAMSNK